MNTIIHYLHITSHHYIHNWKNTNYGSIYQQKIVINNIHNTSSINIFLK